MKYRLKFIMSSLLLLLAVHSSRATEDDRSFIVFDASYGLADNSAQTIMCTKTGRMVISTIGHINFFDGSAFVHIDPTSKNIHELPGYFGHYHLYFDKFHHLWLKDKLQVTCVNLTTECFETNVAGVLREMGVEKKVDDMFGDHNNHMWFRHADSLASPEYGKAFPLSLHAELQDVDVHDSTMLMQFYADGRLSAYDLKHGHHLFDTYSDKMPEGGGDYSQSSVVGYNDGIYYQIRNGQDGAILLSFDPDIREWKLLMSTPYHLNNITPYDGMIYIPCEYGYWVYNIVNGQSTHVDTVHLLGGRSLQTDINAICFDRQGGMWMGTEKRGLLYSRPYQSPFHAYSWEQPEAIHYSSMIDRLQSGTSRPLPRRTNCALIDSRGWTWMGTYTGLKLIRHQGDTVVFTRADGLSNEMVHSIVEGIHHNIWIGTSCGISKLWISGGEVKQITSYDSSDGVPNETFVNQRAVRLDDGTIIMQALDHVVVFNPAELHTEQMRQMVLYPKLTNLLVNGHDVKPGVEYEGEVIIDRAVTRLGEVSVSYKHNSLLLTFSGLNYWRPIQTYYRVRVRGIIDDWQVCSYGQNSNTGQCVVDSQGMLHLQLTALSPGQYIVELQASMTPDKWEMRPFIWIVNVNQPWWRSTGVYVLLVVLLLTLIAANFLLFNRNTRLKLRRVNEESDMLKRIRNYAERCNSMADDILTPYSMSKNTVADDTDADHDFYTMMLKVIPYVNAHNHQRYTISDLLDVSGTSLQKFYELLSANLYKSPLQMVLVLRLSRAADMLLTTTVSEDDIASQLGFVSPNYFRASFYHFYRQTPSDYRSAGQKQA